MFYSGIADEAGRAIEAQIRAHRELGWRHIELRRVGELRRAVPRMKRLNTPYIRIMSYPNDNWEEAEWKKEAVRRVTDAGSCRWLMGREPLYMRKRCRR